MKFKELREANLSKAQINKVHDKADDLPKSDFIKRYGKEGDAVRFATATNIVKKQLGIGEGRIMGISRLNPSYKEGEKAAEKGIKYDKNPYSQSTPGFKRLNWSSGHNAFRAAQLSKAGKPNYGARGQFEELDKEDEKSVGRVIKGLKKAVKAHQGQVDALTKDIKDETELDEFIAPVARVVGKAAVPVAKGVAKIAYKGAKVAVKKGTPIVKKGVKVAIKKGTPIVKKVGKEVGKAALDVAVDVGQGVGDLAKKGAKAAAAVKQKTKDKADVQRLLDRQKRLRAVSKRNEEVVTEAVSAALVNQISRMTDRNNHFGVRIELARIAGDKELMQHYASLEKMHNKLGGVIGNSALEVRQKLESVLKNRLQRKFNDSDADRLMGEL